MTELKGKSWGTDVISKELWIDPDKSYTCGGNPVHNITIQLHNGLGDEITYPVKGTIRYVGFPRKKKYTMWSLDGRANVVWDRPEDNLVLVENENG